MGCWTGCEIISVNVGMLVLVGEMEVFSLCVDGEVSSMLFPIGCREHAAVSGCKGDMACCGDEASKRG